MSKLFKKLNLKEGLNELLILNAPESFATELAQLEGVNVVQDSTKIDKMLFGLAFAITEEELNAVSQTLADLAVGDALLWIAYPKKSSKKYTCEFNRDSGWEVLGANGYEPVRMVAIDADWSALRFRKVKYIKTLKRSSKMAISKEGQKRTKS